LKLLSPIVGENISDTVKVIRLLLFGTALSGEFQLIDHDEIKWLSYPTLIDRQWAPADIPLVQAFRQLISINEFYQKNKARLTPKGNLA